VTSSPVLRLAIVSEGPSDYLVLRSVIERILPRAEVVPIHPEVPVAAYPEYEAAFGGASRGSGWLGVKAWCTDYSGEDLELFLDAVVGQEYDGLIVHVDASMARNLGINELCPPASATTELLRKVIVEDWLRLSSPPSFLVLATPSKSTDAWVVAVLEPNHSNLECDFAVENVLVRLHKLRTSGGQVKKSRDRYEVLARAVGVKISQVRRSCSEADRFANEIGRLSRRHSATGQ
jgi:hypothetical protein